MEIACHVAWVRLTTLFLSSLKRRLNEFAIEFFINLPNPIENRPLTDGQLLNPDLHSMLVLDRTLVLTTLVTQIQLKSRTISFQVALLLLPMYVRFRFSRLFAELFEY